MSPILPVARHSRDDDDDDTVPVPVPRHRAIEPSILESCTESGARRLNRDARRLYSGEISLYRETSASRGTKRRLRPVNFLHFLPTSVRHRCEENDARGARR